jgi:hypothetical protein
MDGWRAISAACLVLLAAPACGGGSGADERETAPEAGEETTVAEGAEPRFGPALVTVNLVVNGAATKGQVALVRSDLPPSRKVRLRETTSFGSFDFSTKAGSYKLVASVLWEIPPPRPGQNLGPARNRPCRAKDFAVDNLFLQIFSRYAVDATARSTQELALEPGDRRVVEVDFVCRLR